MYALFDEAGKFLTGRVMSETEASLQAELDSGKRVKVKAANVLLKFDKPAPAELFAQAQQLMKEIDLDLAWQFAPDAEFGFKDMARDYFDAKAGLPEQVAILIKLYKAPHYFRRIGNGMFKKAPEEAVKAALVGIEKRKQVVAQIEAWANELVEGQCPPPIREQLYKILFKPDKNAPEYKAVVDAAKRTQRAPLDLLKGAGAIESPYQFHWRRFLFEQFPKGYDFPPSLSVPPVKDELPLSDAQAFSIDDSTTTEIDDALSVHGLGTGTVVLGIHIAAPGLAVQPGSELDRVARERLSTMYMPGYKITMLPDDVVQAYTLNEGQECPAVSLYLTLDEAKLTVKSSETRLERVKIVANLRHDKLDSVITEASITGQAPADYPFAAELAFGYRLAKQLKAKREEVRGKPETFNRPDYNFYLDGNDGREPDGTETVRITERVRGAPLDLIVAEAMILANSTWGGWLSRLGVPGIYRSQASLAPGVKVRMSTKASPHMGVGVQYYAWSTSPLRRYVDLVNQWQIIACARHGKTAALAAPFKPKDVELLSIISAFDGAYVAYNTFQSALERFWAMRWLEQNGVSELDASVLKEGLVRADNLPLTFRALGAEGLPRGQHVRVRVTGTDLLTLDLHASVAARLEDEAPAKDGEELEDEDEAGPLALAIDLQDAGEGNAGGDAAA